LYNKIFKSVVYLSIITSFFLILLLSGLFEQKSYYTWKDVNGVTHVTKDSTEIPDSRKNTLKIFNENHNFKLLNRLKIYTNANKYILTYFILGTILLLFLFIFTKNLYKKFNKLRKNHKNIINKRNIEESGLLNINSPDFHNKAILVLKHMGFKLEPTDQILLNIVEYVGLYKNKRYAISIIFTDNPTSRITLSEIMREGIKYNCQNFLTISNNYFDDNAINSVKKNEFRLIDKDEVAELIIKYNINSD